MWTVAGAAKRRKDLSPMRVREGGRQFPLVTRV